MINITPLFHKPKSFKKSLIKILKQFRFYFFKFPGTKYLFFFFVMKPAPVYHLDYRGNVFPMLWVSINVIPNPMRTLKKFIEMLPCNFVFIVFGSYHSR